MKAMKANKGFTLVELSIVLVIIGLLVGGILVGQDMINAAKSRATVSQLENLNAAVNTFRMKYMQLPGDYSLATVNLSDSTQNGDGNGAIYQLSGYPTASPSTIADGPSTNEYALFFQHLSLANLISGSFDGSKAAIVPGANFPRPKTGSGAMFTYTGTDGINYCHIGLTNSSDANIVTAHALRPDEAASIDDKMDDGKPNTGMVRAMGGVETSPDADDTAVTSVACVTNTTSTGEYKLAVLSRQCQLRIGIN